MEISAESFLNLLKNFSEAVEMKPGADYDDFLLNIFKERLKYLNSSETILRSKHDFVIASILRCIGFIGRDDEKSQLSSILLGPDIEWRKNQISSNNNNTVEMQICFVPIVGTSGIGKTTLAREVYDCRKVQNCFELRAWVKVSGQELKLEAVAKEILKSATGMSFRLDDLEEFDEIVRDTLQSHKCLIVFDEIESMTRDSWQHMKNSWFDFMGLGSRVLVTTCSVDVSNLVADIPFKLLEMSHKDADRVVGKFVKSSINLRSNIVSLSQGVPLSLKLIMGMVTYDKNLADLLSSVDLLDNVPMPVLHVSIVILLSIWSLPWHLIQCLAFCTIFPRGYMINRQKLIEKWIAHGLIVSGTEHASGAYFHNLLCRSFFTDVTWSEYGDIEEFRMPGLIHDFVQDVSRIVFKGKVEVVDWISEDAGQLSLANKNSPKQPPTTQIFLSLWRFKNLHTLDLSNSGIRSLMDDICALKEVRYINLSYTLIERLPDSITGLPRLKTLDLSGCCYLQVLPMQMCNLTQLKHLDLWLCDTLSYIPSGIGFLTSLESMTLFVLGKDDDKSVAGLGEIGSLDQLRGKLQIKNLENVRNSEARDAKLNKKYYLRHLELSWSQKGAAADHSELLEILRPNLGLKVLHLTGYMGTKFPSWMLSIKGLTKISIHDCDCEELPSLGQLSALKELQLKGMANLISISTEFYGYKCYKKFGFFPSLEQLGLYDMPRLEVWLSSSSRVFPRLKTLTIDGCPRLQRLQSLPHLPDLIVCNSHRNILRSLSSFGSLSSLLINDMEVPIRYLEDLSKLKLLKKLIIFSNKVGKVFEFHDAYSYTALEHLSFLQCNKLRRVLFSGFASLQKLHILDCQELLEIDIPIGKSLPLIELVIQDCPRAQFRGEFFYFPYLRKLIMKSCGQFEMSPVKFKELKELEYLFISECPQIESQLRKDLSQTSHVPCVILGSHKVEHETYYEGTKSSRKLSNIVTDDSKENPDGVLTSESHLPITVTDESEKNPSGVPTTERYLQI